MDHNINGIYNGVISYANMPEYDQKNEKNYIGNIYTGVKWQCIEFIRRYFITHYGLTFQNVKDVYDMIYIDTFYPIFDSIEKRRLMFIKNNKNIYPQKDDIIYIKNNQNIKTGHVGLVIDYDILKNVIYIADQNNDYGFYWQDKNYAYLLHKNDSSIVGWGRLL